MSNPKIHTTHTEPGGQVIQSEHGPIEEERGEDHPFHVPMLTYYIVFGILIVALLATVGAAKVEMGHLNAPIALIIAFIKAGAIVLIFMHAKFSSKLVQLFACTGMVFASIMFLLTFNDYMTRAMFAPVFN